MRCPHTPGLPDFAHVFFCLFRSKKQRKKKDQKKRRLQTPEGERTQEPGVFLSNDLILPSILLLLNRSLVVILSAMVSADLWEKRRARPDLG